MNPEQVNVSSTSDIVINDDYRFSYSNNIVGVFDKKKNHIVSFNRNTKDECNMVSDKTNRKGTWTHDALKKEYKGYLISKKNIHTNITPESQEIENKFIEINNKKQRHDEHINNNPIVFDDIIIDSILGYNLVVKGDGSKCVLVDKDGNENEISDEMFVKMKSSMTRIAKFSNEIRAEKGDKAKYKFGDRVLLWGPTGSGKTHQFHLTSKILQANNEVDYVEKMTITQGFEDIDFLCYIIPSQGGLRYQEREIISTLREASKGKKVVLCLDELNRGSDSFMNFVLTFIDGVDGDNYVLNNFVNDEKIIIPKENLLIFATVNIGGKYSGTRLMDEALKDRFSRILYVPYNNDTENEIISSAFNNFEDEVNTIVKEIRALAVSGEIMSSISTRGIKTWAEAFSITQKEKEDLVKSFNDTILYRVISTDELGNPNQEELIQVMKIIKGCGLMK